MANNERLDAALRYIIANPEEWDQSIWICETGGCIAGTACLLAGAERIYRSNSYPDPHSVFMPNSQAVVGVKEFAQDLFGLADDEAGILFKSDNSLDDLIRMVSYFKGERQAFTVTMNFDLDVEPEEVGTTVGYLRARSSTDFGRAVVVCRSQWDYARALEAGAEAFEEER